MNTKPQFHDDLLSLGFRMTQEGRRGQVQYHMRATRYLTYWVHWDLSTNEVLFTWEHAIGEAMHHLGLQIGANEILNIFLYPQHDARGGPDITFIAHELDRAEAMLKSIDLTGEV